MISRGFRGYCFCHQQVLVAVQNLYTFTNYMGMDPEIGAKRHDSWAKGIYIGYYPPPRTVMLAPVLNSKR